MSSKILPSLLLASFLLLFALPVQAEDTVLIASGEALRAYALSVQAGELTDARVLLTQDILLSVPLPCIGSTLHPFCGTFDGQGHVISNAVLTGAGEQGLFGVIAPEGCVRDVTIDSAVVIGTSCAGVLAGRCAGTLEECAVTNSRVSLSGGELYGTAAGGLCGSLSGQAYRCSVTGSRIEADAYAGGLCGQIVSGLIEDCLFSGDVFCASRGEAPCGGLAGALGSNAKILCCLGSGQVTSSDTQYSGGVSGAVFSGEIVRSAFSGRLTACGRYTSAVTGYLSARARLLSCRRGILSLPASGYTPSDCAPLPEGPLPFESAVDILLSLISQ